MNDPVLQYQRTHDLTTGSGRGSVLLSVGLFGAGLALGVVALCVGIHGGRILLPLMLAYAGALLCALVGFGVGIWTLRRRNIRRRWLGTALNSVLLLLLIGTPLVIAFTSAPPTPAVRGP
jgi:hypothetical protein